MVWGILSLWILLCSYILTRARLVYPSPSRYANSPEGSRSKVIRVRVKLNKCNGGLGATKWQYELFIGPLKQIVTNKQWRHKTITCYTGRWRKEQCTMTSDTAVLHNNCVGLAPVLQKQSASTYACRLQWAVLCRKCNIYFIKWYNQHQS